MSVGTVHEQANWQQDDVVRILDITETGARLSLSLERLMVTGGDASQVAVPIEDLGVVVLGSPEITITQPAIAGLMRAGAALIVCDHRRLPSGMMLPFQGHHLQTARMRAQAAVTAPLRKRVWQQLIQAKIRFQGEFLENVTGRDLGLIALSTRVRSGDPENLEAQAARRYWRGLPLPHGFRRSVETRDLNQFLNYGYALLRAVVARAICAAGLHPSLGVHHRNQFNAYCLADDLMEPFRPVVDGVVVRHRELFQQSPILSVQTKQLLLEGIMRSHAVGEVKRRLPDAVQLLASSLAKVLVERSGNLELPRHLNHDSAN
jgi:CRISPR-associated protein Cas1